MLSSRYRQLLEGAGDGAGTPGGGGNAPPPGGMTPEDIDAKIAKAVSDATSALKAKNEELINEKKTLLDRTDGLDEESIKKFKDFQKRMENDEEARLIAEGKVDEVISRRTEKMRESLMSRIEDETNKVKAAETKYDGVNKKLRHTLIDGAVRDAAIEAGITPTAIDDVLVRARMKFSYDEEKERIVARDVDTKEILIGEDGKTPYSPNDFMKDLKSKAPHFWPGTSSGGFSGSFGGSEAGASEAQAALHKGGFAAYKEAKDRLKKQK